MTKVNLFKQDGSQIGEIELNAAVFGVEPNEDVIFDAVIMQHASLRQGTHAVKNRSGRYWLCAWLLPRRRPPAAARSARWTGPPP